MIFDGVGFATIFDDIVGVFAKARTGAFWFNSGSTNLTPEKNVYPIINISVIVERYFEKIFCAV